MIREEAMPKGSDVSILRLYKDTSDDPFAPYQMVCTVVWEPPDVAWVNGFHGIATRAMLQELLEHLLYRGVKTVKAHRAESRSLPMGRVTDDGHTEINLGNLLGRRARRR